MSLDVPQGVFDYYPRLRRVRDYVERNLAHELPLRVVADVACLSEKYFSQFFHEKTGVCYRDWLAGLRVERAAELIRANDDALSSVASRVGFGDLRTFQRAFKRRMALTPREYRKQVAPSAQPAPDLRR